MAEIIYTINKRHKFQYEFNFSLLVGAWYQNKPSTLNLISAYGWPNTIEKYIGIGSGERYARVFLKNCG
jgi:20S proteasome alpha/beta subunit